MFSDERIAAWLAEVVDPSFTGVTLTKLAGGYSSGAWRIDGGPRPLVLKAPEEPSVVLRLGREAIPPPRSSRPRTAC